MNSLTSPRYEQSFCQSQQTCKSYRCWRNESIKRFLKWIMCVGLETLLQYADVLFKRPIPKIVYRYGQWQDCFEGIASYVTFEEGIPEDIPALFQGIA